MLNALLPDTVPDRVLNEYGDRLVRWTDPDASSSADAASLSQQLGASLRALRHMRQCLGRLLSGSGPRHHAALVELTVTLRIQIVQLCTQATIGRVLHLAEGTAAVWRLVGQHGQRPRTQLPGAFEAILYEVMPILKQVGGEGKRLQAARKFISFSHISMKHRHFPNLQVIDSSHFAGEPVLPAAHVSDCLLRLLVSLTNTLVQLVRLPTTTQATPPRPASLNLSANTAATTQFVKDKRVLLTLANCDYVQHESLPAITARLVELGCVPMADAERMRAQCLGVYGDVAASLAAAYAQMKTRQVQQVMVVEGEEQRHEHDGDG